tara:strand:- start:5448 stop:6782 length:1335 start_codon:yes stop_codon:yes gene_type:complete
LIIDHTKDQEPVRAGAIIPLIGRSAGVNQVLREDETRGLIESLDAECTFVETLNIRLVNSGQLFGSGQLDSIKQKLTDNDCQLFVVDGVLTPIQQRNLETALQVKVIDRTGLILEIFGLRARTKAGRLQVETARLAYERSRLVRTWTHLERQRGGSGFISGPGETQIEADRRMLDNTLLRLRGQLKEVERTRRVQRSGRQHKETPIVALVGYTNAGKSTLFNRLSGSRVFAKDMPFATLDPTIRQMKLDNATEIALVDTVGFITDLPTSLIESFKATLEESMLADVLLHVHDASSPDADLQEAEVDSILEDLEELMDVDSPPVIHVWNKCDVLSEDELDVLKSSVQSGDGTEPHMFVSALSGEGMETLLDEIKLQLHRHNKVYVIELPETEGKAISWLHAHGQIQGQTSDNSNSTISLSVSLSDKSLGQFRHLFPEHGNRIQSR